MLVDDQLIEVKWNAKTKKHFEEKGYKFTKMKDSFLVKVQDLTQWSKVKVKIQCDFCQEIVYRPYSSLLVSRKRDIEKTVCKDACKECSGKKNSENAGTQYITIEDLLLEEKVFTQEFTEEYLINEFYRYKEEFGVYPRKIDINGNSDYPSASAYYGKWGNWNNLLNSLGIMGEHGIYLEDEEAIKRLYPNPLNSVKTINDALIEMKSIRELKKLVSAMNLPERELYIKRVYSPFSTKYEYFKTVLLDLYSDIGKCPTSTDFDYYTKLNSLPSRRLVEKETGKSFSTLCEEVLNFSNYGSMKTKKELTSDLLKLAIELGRTPKASELVHFGLSHRKAYVKEFGKSYLDILKELELEVGASQKRSYFGQIEMIKAYLTLREELNRLPSWEDVDKCEYTPSYKTYMGKFNSMENLLKIVGVTSEELNQNSSSGFLAINSRSELCRSIPEYNISTLLIDNNISYKPSVLYSSLDNKLKNRWIMDWYIEDSDIYVEYFGLYSASHINRNTRNGKYTRKADRKIDYCSSNNKTLISLFPEDLENNYEGLYKKFLKHGIELKQTVIAI